MANPYGIKTTQDFFNVVGQLLAGSTTPQTAQTGKGKTMSTQQTETAKASTETASTKKASTKKAATKKAATKKATSPKPKAASPKPKATKKATTKAATKAATKKASTPAAPATTDDSSPKLTSKQAALLVYLLGKKATTKAKAVPREKVWEEAAGPTVCVKMRGLGLMQRHDTEDAKGLMLTAKGKTLATQLAKASK